MKGLNDVFIFFVPVVGLCLVLCAFIRVSLLLWRVWVTELTARLGPGPGPWSAETIQHRGILDRGSHS